MLEGIGNHHRIIDTLKNQYGIKKNDKQLLPNSNANKTSLWALCIHFYFIYTFQHVSGFARWTWSKKMVYLCKGQGD